MSSMRRAAITAALVLAALVLMVSAIRSMDRRDVPRYDPEACVDLAWLDDRWTCIPREEAG